ncbi:uncharacterized protein LOC135694761 isoform X2 [Rhopilema esculentum]|uniref:uncharacterized protein LOC135694761 isoform X2 n=1 Tax=Rhopilema esculentum TaxID=499914 RepID=UPI0031CE5EC9|eukprot:gene4756-21058_t
MNKRLKKTIKGINRSLTGSVRLRPNVRLASGTVVDGIGPGKRTIAKKDSHPHRAPNNMDPKRFAGIGKPNVKFDSSSSESDKGIRLESTDSGEDSNRDVGIPTKVRQGETDEEISREISRMNTNSNESASSTDDNGRQPRISESSCGKRKNRIPLSPLPLKRNRRGPIENDNTEGVLCHPQSQDEENYQSEETPLKQNPDKRKAEPIPVNLNKVFFHETDIKAKRPSSVLDDSESLSPPSSQSDFMPLSQSDGDVFSQDDF